MHRLKIRLLIFGIMTLLGGITSLVAAQASQAPQLPACPSSPNCVSSLAANSHYIAPLRFSGAAAAAFTRLQDILGKRSDTRIITVTPGTLQVEFRTRLGFVDDGLFVLDAAKSVILVRSAARTGYWDLGKNRRRLEEIRRQFER